MGGSSNPIRQLGQAVSEGAKDIGRGIEQVGRGQVDQGLSNIVTGSLAVQTGGVSSELGLRGQTGLEKRLSDAADATAAIEDQARRDLAQAQVDKRKDTIRRRIDAEIALRLKRPGRAQTLLTPGQTTLVANPTLLTGGRSNG